jgi:hypothetical protein
MKYLALALLVLFLVAPAGAERLTYAERWPWLSRCLVAKVAITDADTAMVFYQCFTSAAKYELVTSGAFRVKDDGSLLIDGPTTYRLCGADGYETWLSDPDRNGLSGDEVPMSAPTSTGQSNG